MFSVARLITLYVKFLLFFRVHKHAVYKTKHGLEFDHPLV